MYELCSPALLYVVFAIAHIVIDISREKYLDSLVKGIIGIFFTIMLDILCKRGLDIVSWIIIFIPFVAMTLISTLIIIALGEMNIKKENNII